MFHHNSTRPHLPLPSTHDEGFISTTNNQPLPLPPFRTTPDWQHATQRSTLATNTKAQHKLFRMTPVSYSTCPSIQRIHMNIEQFKFDANNNNETNMWTKAVAGYEPALENESNTKHLYNHQSNSTSFSPDPVYPKMTMFGRYVNPLHTVVSLCSTIHQQGKKEKIINLFRNYTYFVTKQYWLTINNRFLVYTGKNDTACDFDLKRTPYIYALFPKVDHRFEQDPVDNDQDTFLELAGRHNLTKFYWLVMQRLLRWYPGITNSLSFLSKDYVTSKCRGTLKTNSSSLYESVHIRELPLQVGFIDEIRELLHDDYAESSIASTKTVKRNPKAGGMRSATNCTNDKRTATFYTHHFIDPIHPLLDMSVYAAGAASEFDWCRGVKNVEALFDVNTCIRQLEAFSSLHLDTPRPPTNKRKSRECKQSPDKKLKTMHCFFSNAGRKPTVIGSQPVPVRTQKAKEARSQVGTEEAYYESTLAFHHKRINHIVLQLLRYAKGSEADDICTIFNVTLDDADFEYCYRTLGSDRLLYSCWVEEKTPWSAHPYLDLIGTFPNSSSTPPPFSPPVWCLNNYTVQRLMKEMQMQMNPLSELHVGFWFAADSGTLELSRDGPDDPRRPQKLTDTLWVLLIQGPRELLSYEQELLVTLGTHSCEKIPFDRLPSVPYLFRLYQALIILSGSHSRALSFLLSYYKSTAPLSFEDYYYVLQKLQESERSYFKSIGTLRNGAALKNCREMFDGENDVTKYIGCADPDIRCILERAVPYLFPLFYSDGNPTPVSPFSIFPVIDSLPLLTQIKQEVMAKVCKEAFQKMIHGLHSTDVISEENKKIIQLLECMLAQDGTGALYGMKSKMQNLISGWEAEEEAEEEEEEEVYANSLMESVVKVEPPSAFDRMMMKNA